jgi:hypothetical protein
VPWAMWAGRFEAACFPRFLNVLNFRRDGREAKGLADECASQKMMPIRLRLQNAKRKALASLCPMATWASSMNYARRLGTHDDSLLCDCWGYYLCANAHLASQA